MGELDEVIIKRGMEKFGMSREETIKQLQELVDEGFLIHGDDNLMLSSKGIEFVEKNMLKKSNNDEDLR